MTPKDLEREIEYHRKEIAKYAGNPIAPASVAMISSHQSEIYVCASQLAEVSTRRIERLTNRLVFLTYVLPALTLGLFVIELAHYYGY